MATPRFLYVSFVTLLSLGIIFLFAFSISFALATDDGATISTKKVVMGYWDHITSFFSSFFGKHSVLTGHATDGYSDRLIACRLSV